MASPSSLLLPSHRTARATSLAREKAERKAAAVERSKARQANTKYFDQVKLNNEDLTDYKSSHTSHSNEEKEHRDGVPAIDEGDAETAREVLEERKGDGENVRAT